MFGEVFHCTECEFNFCSGWSHHTGGQHLVCQFCGDLFSLGGGESCWGAKPGELLQLFALVGEDDVPVGVTVEAKLRKTAPGEKWDGIAYLEVPELACPHCKHTNGLVQTLPSSLQCPKCKSGTVVGGGSCIY